MILADVVQVVGDRTLHVALRVVLQQLEQCDYRSRICLEFPQPGRPRQSWARAFGYEPTHVNVLILGPPAQAGVGLLRIFHEERANARLCAEPLRKLVLRKLWFAHLARAIVVFPGGFGTLDELFELLTLKPGRSICIVLYGSSYWREILNLEALARHGVIAESDLDLLHYADGSRWRVADLENQRARGCCGTIT